MHTMIPKTCQNTKCGKYFEIALKIHNQGGGKYCSLSCASSANYRLGYKSGDTNPNYKGGLSKDKYRYKQTQIERYPEKIVARVEVFRALRAKIITKEPCVQCQMPVDLQAHHEDYNKPLEVIWYCRSHHRELHKDTNTGKRNQWVRRSIPTAEEVG